MVVALRPMNQGMRHTLILGSFFHYFSKNIIICIDVAICDPVHDMSLVVRNPPFWFPTWSDTNQAVQLQKIARGLKFQI